MLWRSTLSVGVMAGSVLLAAPAEAQVNCQVLSEAALLVLFSDLALPATITPLAMRDVICSLFLQPQVGGGVTITNNNTISLSPIGSDLVLSNLTAGLALPIGNTLTAILDATLGSIQGESLIRGPTAWIASTLEHHWGIEIDSNGTVNPGTYPLISPTETKIIVDSVTYYTGGSGTPSFVFSIVQSGTSLTCGGGATLDVTSATSTTTACTAGNTLVAGVAPYFNVITNSGTPNAALMQLNWHLVTQ